MPEAVVGGGLDSFTVVATGDLLPHAELNEQAAEDAQGSNDPDTHFSYDQILAGVRSLVMKADLALCHLEAPLAPEGGPYQGYPAFSAPPELAETLARTGYDSCSTAGDHALDHQEEGVVRTLDTLDAAGVRHTGTARTAKEAATPVLLEIGDVQVGHVSFTYGLNQPRPEGKPWLVNQLDLGSVIKAANAARTAGAEVVIVSLHWGDPYQHEPNEMQQNLAEELLASDAIDLIVGHHAHVVQPIEQIGGQWVAYGLGNALARHEEPRGVTEEGIALRVTFEREGRLWRVGEVEYVPTLVEFGPPVRVIDLSIAEPTPRRTQAVNRTDEIVLRRGGAEAGVRRAGTG